MSNENTPHDEHHRPAVGGPVERVVRPAAPKLGLVERLRQERRPTRWARGVDVDYPVAWEPHALCDEAAAELMRLHGQMETFGRWIVEALKVLDTIDPDDLDESERLMTLIKGGEMLSMSALAPQMWARARKNAGKGPTCNVLRPWEQVE